jgi:enoyl-CoA hydratase
MVSFDITAHDESELVGRGTHRRAVIQLDRFMKRLDEKHPAGGSVLEAGLTPTTGPLRPMQTIGFDVRSGVGLLTLNRPQALNAINKLMVGELRHMVGWLAAHAQDVAVVIVTGAGKAFCAGDDLKEMASLSSGELERWNLELGQALRAFQDLPQVIIASINGHAIGGGFMIACSCDLRIAARGATFGLPEVKMGWPPSFGLGQTARIVGHQTALELALMGRTITSEQALMMGLVGQVVPPTLLAKSAESLARQIMASPRGAVRHTKRLMHEVATPSLSEVDALTHALYMRSLDTADAREGMTAFVEKRAPQFRDP